MSGGRLTLLRGGDGSGLVVDLEEGHVVFVGDLADQGVVQLSVGGRGVVPVQGKDAGKWYAWNDTKSVRLTVAAAGFQRGCVRRTCRGAFSDPGCVNALVEVRSVVVDVQHADCHVNRPVHHVLAVQGLDLDTIANSSRRLQISP